jgi:hypothetical protein
MMRSVPSREERDDPKPTWKSVAQKESRLRELEKDEESLPKFDASHAARAERLALKYPAKISVQYVTNWWV